MAGEILLAAAYLGVGVFAVSLAWFILVTLWITFSPNTDGRTAKMYRRRYAAAASKSFDLRGFMGMK